MRGRPKRNLRRLADRNLGEPIRCAEPWLRFEANLPGIMVGNTVWRIKRRPVWNTLAATNATLSVADGPVGAEALARTMPAPPGERISGYAVS